MDCFESYDSRGKTCLTDSAKRVAEASANKDCTQLYHEPQTRYGKVFDCCEVAQLQTLPRKTYVSKDSSNNQSLQSVENFNYPRKIATLHKNCHESLSHAVLAIALHYLSCSSYGVLEDY